MNRLTVLLVVLALLAGWEVRSWYEGSQVAKVETKVDRQTTALNKHTEATDLHAATRIGAVAAGATVLDRKNTSTRYVPTTVPGANTHAAPAAACIPIVLPSPLASPDFRLRYDAGADPGATAGKADPVPDRSP